MRILIAPDKFKGTLSSLEVINSIKSGMNECNVKHIMKSLEMADGGEGTAAILARHLNAEKYVMDTVDAMDRPVKGDYFLTADGIAIFDMATSAGLYRVQKSTRNLMRMNTRGVGMMVKALLPEVREIIIGLGGSATNDFGLGMAAELGFRFLDIKGKVVNPFPENMYRIEKIETSEVNSKLKSVDFKCLCDVDNPLLGSKGAVYTFARQKGAREKDLAFLEDGMINMEKIVKRDLSTNVSTLRSGGSAGGFGAGCVAFLNAELIQGFDHVAEITKLEDLIADSEMIITGEGKIDTTSFGGKVVGGIVKMAARYNKKVIVVCGQSDNIDHPVEIFDLSKQFGLKNAMDQPSELLKKVGSLKIFNNP